MFYGILKFTKLIVYNTPYLLVKSSIQYRKDAKSFDLSHTNRTSNAFKNVRKDTISCNETYVFIIGESTTKNKMNLYGYQKETNPKLNNIKNELFIFDQVISPHTHTITSLSKSLTLNNYQNPSKQDNGSIIQLMNAAGFKTYWLSNQKPIGAFENLTTKISKGASVRNFINIANHNKKTPYDHKLIKPLKIALNDTANKKAIFIHLLGTHLQYNKRYPKEFEYFTTSDIKDKKEVLINEYDNAVRYNDFVVREIIKEVKAKNIMSYVLYFSDHGEEVYFDRKDFYGHYEEDPTRSMYEIPFILWTSVKYKKLRKSSFNVHNRFMTDELIHAVSDISGIRFTGFDKKRSIFNNFYVEKPRMVRKNISFEELFLYEDKN
ncbi:sulfatase-like hydrolase/transferase [uncultured Aquimarina sp.]|uniref:sulfatase-like hydrolase/transferase n=1 Tax=uncultured Aquimarina sp. TaxID=575652 RepID=UPI0026116220|nr:sulfatase-like hydrolase/transferase [uncultured Aquimarina sp.]